MKLNPSDIYPAVRRFLLESGLNRTLKALEKETSALEDLPVVKPKKAKALEGLELVAACQAWLVQPGDASAAPAPEAESRPNKKRKREEEQAEPAAEAAEAEAAEVEAEAEAEAEMSVEVSNKKSKKQKKEEKEAKEKSTPFKRIDDDKWRATIKDERLLDNTHLAKQKFGLSAGDSWADKASEDLLKVKGKGFRKEMAKKKRASWRGGGEIDQGVNSVRLDNSDDE
ncbi:unnamed protein product [Effrenium voratum]|nr:unnamed protein product [Effrenium voratum]